MSRPELQPSPPARPPAEPAIRTVALTKDFGAGRGVFDLDLEVRHGEILGFIGPNGAGKSTLMRMLVGLIGPTNGRAEVLGGAVTARDTVARRKVGYLAGDFGLYPKLTGEEVLSYLARLRGDVQRRQIAELAARFDADLRRPIRDLSTGSRQKVGLIQALMHEPDLLILDEPIAGLDPLVQRAFHEILADVRARGGTVLLSSHTLAEVDRVADRVAVIRAGRLVTVDTLAHLREVAVRRWEIEFEEPLDPDELRKVPGVIGVEPMARALVVAFEGSPDPLIKACAAHGVRELKVREDDLEQIFLRLYHGVA